MKIKLLLIAMVLAVAVVGCGKKEESEGKAAQGGAEKAAQPAPAGVEKKVEKAATESAEVIEGNVESIEADVKKSEDESTVTPEQLKESAAGETEPQPSAGFVEEEVEVVEEKPAEGKPAEEKPAEEKSGE
jgi:hypothetical protein